jgi:hypothetical protein
MNLTARIAIRKSATYGDRPVLEVQLPGTSLWVSVTARSFAKDGDRINYIALGDWSLREFVASQAAPSAPAARMDTSTIEV